MLIKSPLKKEKVKQNRRNGSANTKKRTIKESFQSNGQSYGQRINGSRKKKKSFLFPRLKPWKVILGAIVIGGLGMLYLNHVFATQELLQEVNQLEREYNQVKRMHSEYKLRYDRMIGPAEIYEKAKQQGFINGGPAEKVIGVEK